MVVSLLPSFGRVCTKTHVNSSPKVSNNFFYTKTHTVTWSRCLREISLGSLSKDYGKLHFFNSHECLWLEFMLLQGAEKEIGCEKSVVMTRLAVKTGRQWKFVGPHVPWQCKQLSYHQKSWGKLCWKKILQVTVGWSQRPFPLRLKTRKTSQVWVYNSVKKYIFYELLLSAQLEFS